MDTIIRDPIQQMTGLNRWTCANGSARGLRVLWPSDPEPTHQIAPAQKTVDQRFNRRMKVSAPIIM